MCHIFSLSSLVSIDVWWEGSGFPIYLMIPTGFAIFQDISYQGGLENKDHGFLVG